MKELLKFVSRPSRYLGCEINAVRKAPAGRLRVALAFPDLYEVGMSHLGIQILYDILNAQEGVACERVFAPWPDMAAVLRRRGLPLATLESDTPLAEFDILGFSLEYELSYSNVLEMLSLAGLPSRSAERTEAHPLILGGGPCCFNPEPLAEFFDAFLLGDGEEAVVEISQAVAAWKAARGSRPELLERLAAIRGVYVPSFFEARYRPDGEFERVVALRPGHERVERRILVDLTTAPVPERPLVSAAQLIHDRLRIELARGCTRGCRFCQAGIIYRPVRERAPQRVLELAERALAASGFEELSLLSLSAGDYGCLAPLLRELVDRHYPQRVALSLPSLRVGTLRPEVIEQVRRVRKTGFTLAPEAATERLRRVINKDISEERLIETARDAYSAGWNLLKLYFMVGLPTETAEDLAAIPGLIHAVSGALGRGRRQVNASLSVFIPKPHTPLQWERAVGPEEARAKLDWLKGHLTARWIKLKWSNPEQSLLEAVFSRGDRRLGAVLEEAHRLGCGFDSWSDQLRPDLWREAFARAGLDPLSYLRERDPDGGLPWGHLHTGVTPEYLRRERETALGDQPAFTPDCRQAGCLNCGVCSGEVGPRLVDSGDLNGKNHSAGEAAAPPMKPAAQVVLNPRRLRIHYAKLEGARYLSHLEMVRLMYRAFRRAGIPVAYTQGFHPLPRLSFGKALPVGVESLAEYLDVELAPGTRPVDYPAPLVAKRLGDVLPEGLKVLGVEEAPPGRKLKPPAEETYAVSLDGQVRPGLKEAAQAFLRLSDCRVEVEGRKGVRTADLRGLVSRLEVEDDGSLRLVLRLQTSEVQLRPEVVLRHVFGLTDEEVAWLTVLKVG
ncbi:MAG: TIGR03960 family B12-binding radical SAM protein [Pseudomonadota bacterium]